MPFTPPNDYWIEIPGGRYTIGLLPDEARRLAEESAKQARLDPPTPGLNDWKNLRKLTEWEEMDCNVEWLTEYLLAHYPAREVDIEPFAIARRPVTNAEYSAFMADTGEIAPGRWGYPPKMRPDDPADEVDWPAALAFAEWAGARFPFEAEWERAMRGPERRLFPWGNAFVEDHAPLTPDGIMVGRLELCADIWQEPPGLDRARWNEQAPSVECRCLRGGVLSKRHSSLLAPVARCPAYLGRYGGGTAGMLRLARADGRKIPAPTGKLDRNSRAMLDVRTFEIQIVRRTLENLRASRISHEHTIEIGSSNELGWWLADHDRAARAVKSGVCRAIRRGVGPHAGGDVRAGFDPDPTIAATRYNDGLYFVARSRETFRRVIPEHGVFVWGIGYRLAEDGQVRARHIAGFHMAFDKAIHTLTYQFRHGEVDTPIRDITGDMIASGVLEAFRFYEAHSDADRSPF
jgi:hypothetical protein